MGKRWITNSKEIALFAACRVVLWDTLKNAHSPQRQVKGCLSCKCRAATPITSSRADALPTRAEPDANLPRLETAPSRTVTESSAVKLVWLKIEASSALSCRWRFYLVVWEQFTPKRFPVVFSLSSTKQRRGKARAAIEAFHFGLLADSPHQR